MKKFLKTPQFPNIYRTITESHIAKRVNKAWNRLPNQSNLKKSLKVLIFIFFTVFFVIIVFSVVISTKNIYYQLVDLNNLLVKRQNVQSQINFWNSVSQKYPGYKDAYFRMAVLEYQLGDFNSSKLYNNKALLLDPNFKDAKKLENLLSNY